MQAYVFTKEEWIKFNEHMDTYLKQIEKEDRMPAETKAVNLTEDEIKHVLTMHGHALYGDSNDIDNIVERINYLNKRLKAFNEDKPPVTITETAQQPAQTVKTGW